MKVFSKKKYLAWQKLSNSNSTWADLIPDGAPLTFYEHTTSYDVYTTVGENGTIFYITSDWADDAPDTMYVVLFYWKESDIHGAQAFVHATLESARRMFNHIVQRESEDSWVKDAWTDGKLNDGYAYVSNGRDWSVSGPNGNYTCVSILCEDVRYD